MKPPSMLRGLRRAHFPVITADVPWEYAVRSKKGTGRSASNHYATMSLDAIRDLPVARHAAPNGRLLFWITGPFLALGAHVPIMQAWGFEPVSIWGVWVKPKREEFGQGRMFVGVDDACFRMGLGFTTRQNAEFVVEGRRGNPPARLSMAVRQVMVEPIRQHSRKPDKFYANVETYAAGPYLELFGRRTKRPGWTIRGDEVGKFR